MKLVQFYSYLFHFVLGLFLFAVALVAWVSGLPLRLDQVPWQGDSLTYWMLASGLFGIATVILAFLGRLRVLFVVWAAVVLVMLFRGYIFSGFRYEGMDHFRTSLYLIAGALLALLGAILQFRSRRSRV
jgi:uncharacterized membrane protein YdcZ (DUF606 family)